ncbi:MAG TPA: acyl-CoA thioesterase [Pirellulales bacterium]|nr:acyl-CoA thioesterase [Pirellulales bacterium]
MPAIFDYRHTIVAEEIDALEHVNNLAYLAWMQAAALEHSAVQGWPPESYQKLGLGWVVRSHQITYERPAFLGEEVIVRTWVAGFRRASSVRRYDILRGADGKRLATAATNWAFVNYANGLPARVPPEIVASFEIVEDASQ